MEPFHADWFGQYKYDSFKYLLLVTFETDDNYSIRFEMKQYYSHSTSVSVGGGDLSMASSLVCSELLLLSLFPCSTSRSPVLGGR